MSRYLLRSGQLLLGVGLALSASSAWVMAAPPPGATNAQQTAPDNTRSNKDQTPPTADQQKQNASDLALTRDIRKSIHDDKSLSTYASNIKIIAQDGKVTLRGPVRSEEEKSKVEAKAAGVAGRDNVTSEIKVAPSK